MQIEQVVRQVTVRGTVDGLDKVTQGYSQVATSADASAVAVGKQASSAAVAEAALNRLALQQQASLAMQQQYADMIAHQTSALQQVSAANDNLVASNDNAAASFRSSGLEIAEVANHLRQGAEAAYVFSPAFRAVVNGMAPTVLSAAGVAIAAVASGIVTGVNVAGTGLISLAGAAEKVAPGFVGATSAVRAAGVAMQAFNPVVANVATSVLGVTGAIVTRFLPIIGQLVLVYDVIKMVGEAWALGAAKLKEYVDLSAKAASLGVSTDFLQRLTKGAEEAKIPVETLTTAIKNMNDALAPKLGGSDGLKRLDELKSYGNFKGNTGVTELKQATNPEQQFSAILDFYRQATDAGEKLAALDVVKTILGPDVAKNLAADDQYLENIQAKMTKVEETDLVKQDDIDRAVALQSTWDAAVKILETRWHPIQNLLTSLGMKMHELWVNIVSVIATAVDKVFSLAIAIGNAIAKAAELVSMFLSAASTAAKIVIPGFGLVAAGVSYLTGSGSEPASPQDAAMAAARNRLTYGLSNPANVTAARRDAQTMSEQLRPDKSIAKAPDATDTTAWDRAVGSIQKYIEVTNAAAKSVDAGVAEQERLKAIAELTAAGIKDGLTPETAKLNAEMSKLPGIAGAAAEALAKAKVASEIRFGGNTGLLSQQDVQIATQLKGLYPDVATALNSVEAAGLRANDAAKQLSSAIENNLTTGFTDILDGQKSIGQGAQDMAVAFARSIDQMVVKILIVEPLLRQLQALVSASGILSFGAPGVSASGAINGGVGPTSINGAPLVGLHGGGIVGSEATFSRYVHPAYFDDATRFHSGGIAGDEVPIIARKGEGVFTAGQMAALGAMAGGAPQVNVTLVESPGGGGGVTQRKNNNGGFDIQVEVAQIAAKSAATPGGAVNRVLTDQYRGAMRLTGR